MGSRLCGGRPCSALDCETTNGSGSKIFCPAEKVMWAAMQQTTGCSLNRQSTSYQVANNLESQRRQYGLVERGHQLGWSDVQVIDDDLGRSGGGIARPRFEKLPAGIRDGRGGAG